MNLLDAFGLGGIIDPDALQGLRPPSPPCPHAKQAEPRPADFTRAKELTPEVEAAVRDAFEYHAWDAQQLERGARIRQVLVTAVLQIIEDVPPGPDRSAAIRKIREARMDCNSAITHKGKY